MLRIPLVKVKVSSWNRYENIFLLIFCKYQTVVLLIIQQGRD